MLTPASKEEALVSPGMEDLSSQGVLAILFVLLIVLGVYPAPIMAIIETISVYI